jgi:hypothetical protein
MRTTGRTDTTYSNAPPFDLALSLRLDSLIIALEADDQPPVMRRVWLKVQKRWAERHVPAYHCEGGAW